MADIEAGAEDVNANVNGCFDMNTDRTEKDIGNVNNFRNLHSIWDGKRLSENYDGTENRPGSPRLCPPPAETKMTVEQNVLDVVAAAGKDQVASKAKAVQSEKLKKRKKK